MTERTITAIYDSRDEAERARMQLRELGLDEERVRIIDQSTSAAGQPGERDHKGFWASIKEFFVPDESDRPIYEEGLRRGGFLLLARVEDREADSACRILEQSNAIDLDARQSEWRQEGWDARFGERQETARGSMEEQSIPLVEEHLRVGKREVNRGGLRVRSYIVEEPVHDEVRLREERVQLERRPVNEPLRHVQSGSSEDLLRERTLEMDERAEEAVVDKEAVVREELVASKRIDERTERVDDTVRRTEVEIDDEHRKLDPAAARRKPKTSERPDRRTH
jgi:uncharacterized protein (TIGR02271 family)